MIQALLQAFESPVNWRYDPARALGVLAGALLVCLMTYSIIYLPPIPQVVMMLSLTAALFFFTRPELSVIIFFGGRAVIDMFWWIPVKVAGLNVMELFSGAVSGLALVLFYLEFKRFNKHPGIYAFIPFCAALAVAALRNLDVRQGAEILARYMSPFLMMFLVTAFCNTPYKRRRLFNIMTAVCGVPILISLYHLATGQMSEFSLDGYNRLVGGYANLHNHALMMLFIACLGSFWLMLRTRVTNTVLWGLYVGGALMCLYFTYVRTVLVGLVAFGAVYLWVTRRRNLLIGLIIVGGLFGLTNATIQDRLSDIILFLTGNVEQSADRWSVGSGRLSLWTVSFTEYMRKPLGDILLGLGLGKHRLLTESLYSVHYYAPSVGYVDPHNDYLSMLYQMGPIALAAYLAAQIQVIRYGFMARNHPDADAWTRELGAWVIGLSAAVTVTNFVSNAFVSRTTPGWYFWGIAGLLYGEVADLKRRAEEGAEGGTAPRPRAAG